MPRKRRGELARKYPQRRVELPRKPHVAFETLVERALDGLPDEFQDLLADVAIVIEEAPTHERSELGGVPGDSWLYGLYDGVPSTEWGGDMVPFPNKITLFRLPLEADFPNPADLEEQVRITVIHELAHHAGIDDDRLHELEYD